MARYQVILAYDGTEFKGFQRQAEARTVQGVVEVFCGNLIGRAGLSWRLGEPIQALTLPVR